MTSLYVLWPHIALVRMKKNILSQKKHAIFAYVFERFNFLCDIMIDESEIEYSDAK
jgi:hypothetical protein